MTSFIEGNTAGLLPYEAGQPPAGRFKEIVRRQEAVAGAPADAVHVGAHVSRCPTARAARASGRTPASPTEAVRWPTGAALMPDATNVLITYLGVSRTGTRLRVEAWGFALYNWQKNKFSMPPTDVFPASASGSPLAQKRNFGSPVVADGNITLYSWKSAGGIYATSLPANVASLEDQASYDEPQLLSDVGGGVPVAVAPPSPTLPQFTMLQLNRTTGSYQLRTAPDPDGPWTASTSGTLPGCQRPAERAGQRPVLLAGNPLRIQSAVAAVGDVLPARVRARHRRDASIRRQVLRAHRAGRLAVVSDTRQPSSIRSSRLRNMMRSSGSAGCAICP